MPRSLPAGIKEDIVTPNTGSVWMWLCEVNVPNYDVIRKARNTKDVVYGNKAYIKHGIDIGKQVLSGDGSIPRVVLRISQDVNKTIETIINDTQGGLGTTVKLIKVNSEFLGTAIPALEANYDLLLAESDEEWVSFTLGIPNPLTQRIPLRIWSASGCPWATPTLFKGARCQYAGVETTCTGTYRDCKDNKSNEVHWGGELGLNPNVTRA